MKTKECLGPLKVVNVKMLLHLIPLRLLRTDFLVDEETDSGLIFTRSFHCLGVRLYLSHGDAFVSEKLN